MRQDLERRARELAGRPYMMVVMSDETTDGEPGFVALIPELPGCMSGGETRQEALENLRDAQFEYILSLLEDGLPVPEPGWSSATTTTEGGEASSATAGRIGQDGTVHSGKGAENSWEFREVVAE